jgi:Big-like domain-containing protein
VESPSSGDLHAGKTVTLTLNLSEAVTVAGGTPTLTLNDGGTATYTSGSGTSALVFSYTVGAGQHTSALTATAFNLNSATVTDGAGNAANLSLSGLTQTGPQIDTRTPAAPVITNDTINANNSVTLTGTAEANSTVTVYDGTTALGTTTAAASGAWTYTTGTLANGTQIFTATVTDAAGNLSAASNTADPIIGPASVAEFMSDETALNEVVGGFAISDTAANVQANLAALTADGSHISSITATGGQIVVGNRLFVADAAALNEIVGGFTIVGQAPVLSGNLSGLEADISHINSITGLNGTITASVAEFTSDETALNEVVGGFAISDTAANVQANLAALTADASHISSITATGGQIVVGNGLFVADAAALNEIVGGFTIVGQAPVLSGNLSGLEADISHINSITGLNGTITASVAEFTSDETALNEVVGGFAISDTAANVQADLAALTADASHITSITAMQQPGNAPASIASGTVLEINTPDSGTVSFAGSTGTLWLDQPSTFTGTVSGFNGQDVIDLPGIAFGANTTLGYLPNSNQTGGTLSLSDGTLSAKIALLGNYMASSFVTESDDHGGTMVVAEASLTANPLLLTASQHA